METKENLISERNLLAIHRERISQIKSAKASLIQTITDSPGYKELENAEQLLKKAIEDGEQQIKKMAVELYKLNPVSKQVVPGINIREETIYDYDENKAFEYAKKHQLFLKFDPKGFEKFAKDNVVGNLELEFVTVMNNPTATIATDLTKFCMVSEKEE